jgi:hypothetical protein
VSSELEAFVDREGRELLAQLPEDRGHREVGVLRLDGAGLELADVEQEIHETRHRGDRLLLLRVGL